jgi:hypothetical protein
MNLLKALDALASGGHVKIVKYSDTNFVVSYAGWDGGHGGSTIEAALRAAVEQRLGEAKRARDVGAREAAAFAAALEDGLGGCDTCDVQTPAKESTP